MLHITLLMLPLKEEGKLKHCVEVLKSIEDQIIEMVEERGAFYKLRLEFDPQPGIFGDPS